MHPDEVFIDEPLVRRLIASQFPSWRRLPLVKVESSGTDNSIYRLGRHMAIRLPRISWAKDQVQKECKWLPLLAPQLPLTMPVPLAMGIPAEGYPWYWAVHPWMPGKTAVINRINNKLQAAETLAGLLNALQAIDASDGPLAGSHNSHRGIPLAERDEQTRHAIIALQGSVDSDAATAVWQSALDAPPHPGKPVWVHGDIQSGNLLAAKGKITTVIDFGCLGVGDPACDLMIAWNLLPARARKVFRKAVNADDAAWARGRGWALSVALVALPYYRDTNPILAAMARYTIDEILDDYKKR